MVAASLHPPTEVFFEALHLATRLRQGGARRVEHAPLAIDTDLESLPERREVGHDRPARLQARKVVGEVAEEAPEGVGTIEEERHTRELFPLEDAIDLVGRLEERADIDQLAETEVSPILSPKEDLGDLVEPTANRVGIHRGGEGAHRRAPRRTRRIRRDMLEHPRQFEPLVRVAFDRRSARRGHDRSPRVPSPRPGIVPRGRGEGTLPPRDSGAVLRMQERRKTREDLPASLV